MYATPSRYKLPVIFYFHILFKDCEPELRNLKKLLEKKTIAIDVGANIGLYSYALSRHCQKVHAFEVMASTCQPLDELSASNIDVHHIGLSNHAGKVKLFTPVHETGLELSGWASLSQSNFPDAVSEIETLVQVATLDSYFFDECCFLKIDVEGHELEVLEGAVETIKRTQPRILVEVKQDNLRIIDLFLGRLGYRRLSVQHLINHRGSDQNFYYVPK